MPFGAAISMLGVIEADNVKNQTLHIAGWNASIAQDEVDLTYEPNIPFES
jgi:hypothetical protein